MNLKNPLWQFVKDGLVGVVTPLIVIGIFSLIFGFDPSFFIPILCVTLIGFISMGIGGRFLGNISSRRSWIKPIFIISIVSMLMGIVLITTIWGDWDWEFIPFFGIPAGIGFLIASLTGIIFNPTKRMFRLAIGEIPSAIVGFVFVNAIGIMGSQ